MCEVNVIRLFAGHGCKYNSIVLYIVQVDRLCFITAVHCKPPALTSTMPWNGFLHLV